MMRLESVIAKQPVPGHLTARWAYLRESEWVQQ